MARQAVEMDFSKELASFPIENAYEFKQTILNPDGSLELVKKYHNFDSVKVGELLAKNLEKKIYSEVEGRILFPKYGDYAKTSAELALILAPYRP